MCGIVGVMYFKQPIDFFGQHRFETGLGLMRGRGPDGYWVYADHSVLLGQTLLLITDPVNGLRPYVDNRQNVVACANGEIYNFRALRDMLQRAEVQFSSNSDCDVIAHGYALWQDHLFERLDGMFGIAVFDRQHQTLTLARDKVGIRPLYYTYQKDYIAFASEPRVLIAAGFASSDPSEEGLFHSLVLRRALDPVTMYKKIRSVLPGQQLTFDRQGRVTERIFAAIPPQALGGENGLQRNIDHEAVRQVVTEAVSRRVPDHCKYSLFLSGGLDSTIVNFLTPVDPGRRLPSLVCGFSFENTIDERLMAQEAANLVNTDLITRSVSLERFLAIWPVLVWAHSEPLMFNSSIPLFLLCCEAREKGAKVILSGEGADEMFAGYLYYPTYEQTQDDGTPDYLLRHNFEINAPNFVIDHWLANPQWGNQQKGQLLEKIDAALPFKGKKHGLARELEFDRLTFMRALLMRQDCVGLTTGIEIRVPFLDTYTLHEATKYPTTLHLANGIGKQILRQTFAPYITHKLAKTPKIGFPVPVDAWLSHPEFKSLCLKLNDALNTLDIIRKDILLSMIAPQATYTKESYKHLWTLLNVALWWTTQTSASPPHGVWADLLPPGSHREVANIVGQTQYTFNSDTIPCLLDNCELPVVIHSHSWNVPEINQLQNFSPVQAVYV